MTATVESLQVELEATRNQMHMLLNAAQGVLQTVNGSYDFSDYGGQSEMNNLEAAVKHVKKSLPPAQAYMGLHALARLIKSRQVIELLEHIAVHKSVQLGGEQFANTWYFEEAVRQLKAFRFGEVDKAFVARTELEALRETAEAAQASASFLLIALRTVFEWETVEKKDSSNRLLEVRSIAARALQDERAHQARVWLMECLERSSKLGPTATRLQIANEILNVDRGWAPKKAES